MGGMLFSFSGKWAISQPWRGFFVLIITLAASLILTASFGIAKYTGPVGYFTMTFIPMFVIIGMWWKPKNIIPLEYIPQPFKGLLLLLLSALVGILFGMGFIRFLGGGFLLPHVVLHMVCSIITIFFIALAFGFWPFNRLSPVAGGFLTIIVAFIIGWIVLQLFNFEFLSYPYGIKPSPVGAVPFYTKGGPLEKFVSLAPTGPFRWEHAISFYFWGIAMVFSFVLLGFWPFTTLKVGQPTFGIIVTVCCLLLSYLLNYIGVELLNVEPLKFFLYGISYVFGILLLLVPLQTWPGRIFDRVKGGIINILISIGIGVLAYRCLFSFCKWHFGESMVYPNNIFAVATAMLGMIFPMWSAYCDLLDGWPLPTLPNSSDRKENEKNK